MLPNTRKHDHLPFTKDTTKQNKIIFKCFCFHLNCMFYFSQFQQSHRSPIIPIPNQFLVGWDYGDPCQSKWVIERAPKHWAQMSAKQMEVNSALAPYFTSQLTALQLHPWNWQSGEGVWGSEAETASYSLTLSTLNTDQERNGSTFHHIYFFLCSLSWECHVNGSLQMQQI